MIPRASTFAAIGIFLLGASTPAAELQEKADALFAAGQFTAAAGLYRDSLSEDENNARNRFLLASILFEQHQYQAAHDQFSAITRQNPNAQGSAVLARLCTRRLDAPHEPLNAAVEALLIPLFTAQTPQSDPLAKAPVIQGLLGESMLRMGPSRINPAKLDALLAASPDEPLIQLGVIHLKPRSTQPALLQSAAQSFPKSAPIAAARLSAVMTPGASTSPSDALAAADTLIALDPDNAYPKLLRFALNEANREPLTQTAFRFTDDALARLNSILLLPSCNALRRERTAAARSVLQKINHPFTTRLVWVDQASFAALATILGGLSASADLALAENDPAAAEAAFALAEKTVHQWSQTAFGNVATSKALPYLASISAKLANHHARSGSPQKAALAHMRQGEYQQQIATQVSIPAQNILATLPIPSIANPAIQNIIAPPTP